MTSSTRPLLLPGQIFLPSEEVREVLHHWRMVVPPAPVFRSLERVQGAYYMVSRVLGDDGRIQGGDVGVLLSRRSAHHYVVASGRGFFRISEDGTLYGHDDEQSEPHMICQPIEGLAA